MASVGTGVASSGGRRKSLDAELNLVPFIDLLSMCICFLLMTAVWIEIGAIQVKQSHGTEAAASKPQEVELGLKMTSPMTVELSLKKSTGKTFIHEQLHSDSPANLLGKLDNRIQTLVHPGGNPTPAFTVASGMVTPGSGVSYGNLIGVMDVLRKNKVVNLGVVPVSEGVVQ